MKINNLLKIIWLSISVLCLAAGIHQTVKFGLKNSYVFFILSALALIMFMLRRKNILGS